MDKRDDRFTEQELAVKRTMLSILRTRLSAHNAKLTVEQTHLSFLRTIVSLVGSAATIYAALPALGVSNAISTTIAVFLIIAAIYFTINDRITYPKLKKEVEEIERLAKEQEADINDEI
ncbi:MAG: hypothetical protein K6G03_04175 [Lachnospiraceae bacterium]|nr:hypothetical protein [Lachnospiraceae bacterium]